RACVLDSPLVALSGHAEPPPDVCFRGQTGHPFKRDQLPLVTQSGHEGSAFAAMHGRDLLYLTRDACSSGKPMRRREFIILLGGAVAWPLVVRAQRPVMPLIGFLHSRAPEDTPNLTAAFHQGLKETGYVEGQHIGVHTTCAKNHKT